MTTPQSPDGQQPQTPNSGAQTPEGEPIRNMDDARKAFVARDEFKAESQRLAAMLEALGGKLDALARPQTPAAGEQTPANPLEAKLEKLAGVVESIVGDKQDEAKKLRRKTITDSVIAAAKEDQRELIRGALSTLVLDGAVDIHAENTAGEVDKALTSLRAAHPAAFAPASGSSSASAQNHDLIPPGVQLHELTREQLARMSDEDFSKARKAARTSRLAV